jgi:hypothetical protein
MPAFHSDACFHSGASGLPFALMPFVFYSPKLRGGECALFLRRPALAASASKLMRMRCCCRTRCWCHNKRAAAPCLVLLVHVMAIESCRCGLAACEPAAHGAMREVATDCRGFLRVLVVMVV